jgi:hypothetical protein
MLTRLANETDKAYIARLTAALTAKNNTRLSIKASEKGAVSVYGMGRFPVTLYKEQWTRLAEFMPSILEFIKDNDGILASKEDSKEAKREAA